MAGEPGRLGERLACRLRAVGNDQSAGAIAIMAVERERVEQ
jgi:hypothetical protein